MRIKCIEPPKWMSTAESSAKTLWPYCNDPNYQDDPIAAVVGVSDVQMEICWISYSLKWAQDRERSWPFPPMTTLSVCAIVSAGPLILVGKRSSHLLSFPDLWEFAPAGGVDSSSRTKFGVDLKRQVLKEWSEEVSSDTQCIVKIEQSNFLYCAMSSTWVCPFLIESQPFNPATNAEVVEWRWDTLDRLTKEIDTAPDQWVPGSDLLLMRKQCS